MATQKSKLNANTPIMWVAAIIYGALLLLFGWQTWQFITWLFPEDQLLARILTLISFDVMAAVWAIDHTFYRFKSRGAWWWVGIAWVITFVLSLVASILYLVVQFYFRFHLGVDQGMVNTGYGVSIFALVFNILALMFFLVLEWRARHPKQHDWDLEEEAEEIGHVTQAQITQAIAVLQAVKGTQQIDAVVQSNGTSAKNLKSPR
jgi:hypothetical protein